MNEIDTFGIEITKSYREKEFHEDIKSLMRICGVEGKDMQFLFSDTQIVMESFLEDINNLLNSGEIPNLFPPDEKVAICEEIESKAREDGEGNGRDAQFNWFVS
jgi:dynein heavy chain